MSLSEAATALGYIGFDWVQTVIHEPSTSPMYAANNPTVPLTPPYSDPPQGGYTNTPGLNSFPFYFDPNNGYSKDDWYNLRSHTSASGLDFLDVPADNRLLPGEYIGFVTALVGILPGYYPGKIFREWYWTSDFNGTSGGVNTRINKLPVDPGSGTGGVAITVSPSSPSITWTGGGANDNWSTADNWGGSTPMGNQVLYFGPLASGAHATNQNDSWYSAFNGIVFSPDAAAYELKGNYVRLAGPVINNSPNTQSISLPIYLTGGTCFFATNSGNITVNGTISEWNDSSSITKTGSGTMFLAGYNSYSGGTTVSQGTLQLGNPASLGTGGLVVGAGGTVDLNGVSPNALPSLSGNPGAVITDNSMPAGSPSPTILTVNIASGTSTFGGGIVKGTNGQDIALSKNGYGTLTLSGISNYSGGTLVNQGTLNVTGTLSGGSVLIASGATLTGSGIVNSSIAGGIGSSIVVSGNLSLGDSTSYTGFNYASTLAVGANSVTLNSKGFANLGILTTLNGGTLSAPNGVSLGVGGNLSGSGAVNGKVAAGYGSTVNATGNLTLGDSTKYDGFVSDGELYTNNNTVTLSSKNAANNHNAVVLGALTQIDGGMLEAPNGILLENGKNLVTTDAGGTVGAGNGPSTSCFLNRGSVQGPSLSSSNWLIFDMPFKASTGQTSGRIWFLDGVATGDLDVQGNFIASSIEVDTLTIESGSTLTIQAIPGGPLSDIITAVPEPSTFALLAAALLILTYSWAIKWGK